MQILPCNLIVHELVQRPETTGDSRRAKDVEIRLAAQAKASTEFVVDQPCRRAGFCTTGWKIMEAGTQPPEMPKRSFFAFPSDV
jgi:hypothetical protein